MIGFCGIECSECGAYIATKDDDDDHRAEVAAEWSKKYDADIRPEMVQCTGCTGDGVKFFFCEKMCEIRKCCTEKSHPHCAVCDDYACDRLSAFFGQVPEAQTALDALRK